MSKGKIPICFWTIDIDTIGGANYLEHLDSMLKAAGFRVETKNIVDSEPTGYIEPEIISEGIYGLKAVALDYYLKFGPNPESHFNQALAIKKVKCYSSSKVIHGLRMVHGVVEVCFFAPVKNCFEQLYYVMTKDQAIGIYINGNLIGSIEKSNPVVTIEMMKQFPPSAETGTLKLLCKGMSEAAKDFVANAIVG